MKSYEETLSLNDDINIQLCHCQHVPVNASTQSFYSIQSFKPHNPSYNTCIFGLRFKKKKATLKKTQ